MGYDITSYGLQWAKSRDWFKSAAKLENHPNSIHDLCYEVRTNTGECFTSFTKLLGWSDAH